MRPHRALAATLARELRRCGAEVDLERTVVELTQTDERGRVTEAILDLVLTFPGSVQPLYVDVTIRSPHASRYERAHHRLGGAAAAAVREKFKRYGSSVLAIAFESYGRLAVDSHRALEHLAAHAGVSLREWWAAPRLLPTWRAALEKSVHFSIAETDLLALGCSVTAVAPRIAAAGCSRAG